MLGTKVVESLLTIVIAWHVRTTFQDEILGIVLKVAPIGLTALE